MSLAPGARLGPYEIVAPLGAGGMGEVYRARDTRLGREVAIKVLPAEFAADPDRLRRFEQEARAASALNHPNILVVYDVGTHEGAPYLVTELLEGESLRARLQAGAFPARKAVELAVQVCAGLAAAHEKGIIHRDLKPENLFVTSDGHVKILDFGIAKLLPRRQQEPAEPGPTVVDTTEPGTLLGTVAYMSPEQVRGLTLDHRTDLFSFGAVLYEMVTGMQAFARGTAADTMSAILKEEPPEPVSIAPTTPLPLSRAILHCLEKRPEERFQSARDLAFDLEAPSAASGEARAGLQAASVAARSKGREHLVWGGVVAAVAVAIVAAISVRWPRRPPSPPLVRFAVTAPGKETVAPDTAQTAISPDGRQLVFTALDPASTARLWIRPLDSNSAQPLPGTEGALCPFWSPDSRFVAFFADGKLKKVAVGGGAPEVICNAPDGRGGSWSKDGVIVFAPLAMGPLMRVAADGGEATEVARPDPARHETGLRFPQFLPDGRHFLYVSLPRRHADFEVYRGALDAKEHERIMAAGSAPVYAQPGYLLFARGGRLVAQRVDRSSARPVGEETPLGDAPSDSTFEGAPRLSASATGVLVRPATNLPDAQLVWLDAAGRLSETVPIPPDHYAGLSLSPDGRWAAVTKSGSPGHSDLWTIDLQRAVATRLTFDGLVSYGPGLGVASFWSPDGRRIATQYNRSGSYDIYEVLASGVGRPEPLVQSEVVLKAPAAWSPDGRYLVFSQNDETTGWDLWLLPLQGNRTPVPYLRSPFNEIAAAISPDGRWLAYDSDETGTPEIYVRSFPEPGEKHRVSTSGGTSAQWSNDGRKLLIWTGNQFLSIASGPVLSVDVETEPSFKAGTPRVLFTPRLDLVGLAATGDLTRFLALVPVEGAARPSIEVTLNWQAALKR